MIDQLGEPAGVLAFDPRSFPKRGRPAVGVKRQWGSHRGKGANCQGGLHAYKGRLLENQVI